MLKLTEAIG